jgi:4-amino-4-deoxy-L-arabinose transferase-like glycosyltransferase
MMEQGPDVEQLMRSNPLKMKFDPFRKILLLILAGGLLVRIGPPGSLAIDHFDEGIYALAGQWIYQPGGLTRLDPTVIPYGPPVTSVLIGIATFLLGGPSDFAAILPGIICGTLSILIAFQFCRRIFGETEGLIAASLIAFSGMAVAFSRTALTDTPLLLFWLMAIQSGLKFLEKPGLKYAILMGMTVGLCQLTKYNGALTGIIISATALLEYGISFIQKKSESRIFVRQILFGIFGALVAFAVYLPWLLYVEKHGGYRSLMNHHSGYISPLMQWPDNFKMQLVQAWAFDQFFIMKIMLVLLIMTIYMIDLNQKKKDAATPRKLAYFSPLLITFLFIPNAGWFISLLMLPRLLKSNQTGARLLCTWFLLMSVITPFYHPYARLWLPTQIASFCIAAQAIALLMQADAATLTIRRPSAITASFKYFLVPLFISLLITEFRLFSLSQVSTDIYRGRGAMRQEVALLAPSIEKTLAGQRIEVLISPAVRWHLLGVLNTNTTRGQLASLENLKAASGRSPLLIDLSLVRQDEINALPEPLRSKIIEIFKPPSAQNRGLITTLDLAPDAPLHPPLPTAGLVLIN